MRPIATILVVTMTATAGCAYSACGVGVEPASPRAAATPTPPPAGAPAAAPAAATHLVVAGTTFRGADGRPFAWRGITAFRLLDYLADGDEARTVAFLEWAASQQLTLVRVLVMMGGQFDLQPADGRRVLPRLLQLAAERGLHVEIVALAGTKDIPVNLREHLAEVGRIAGQHANALLEIANEPVHPSQSPEVHKPEVLRGLADTVPDPVPIALGSIERGDGFGNADYITWHVPREEQPDGWGHVLEVAHGAALIAKWQRPVVNDEAIGAGASYEPGRRDDNPARFRAAALLTRLVGMGATFHYQGGIQAVIPTGVELRCLEAWNDAWTLLPADIEQRGVFRRSGEPGAAIGSVDRARIIGAFERATGDEAWALVLGPADATVQPAAGWRVDRTQAIEGGRLLMLSRSAS